MTRELVKLGEGQALAQYGPMRLAISAQSPKGPDTELALAAGKHAFSLLPRLAPAQDLFRRRPDGSFNLDDDFSEPLLAKMAAAVKLLGQDDLGPMATVAGLVSEMVAEFLHENGAVKAIVENGGDLAIILAPGYSASVGVRPGLDIAEPTHCLELKGDVRSVWGICSSGLGGRSLTRGIAGTALCLAPSATVADAAATALGNACRVDSPAVKMVPAEMLRPDTDIPALMVTESVGVLTADEIEQALAQALDYAEMLVSKEIILGALVALRGRLVLTKDFNGKAAPIIKT